MRGGRGRSDPPAAAQEPRVNRLSRSFRLSQAVPAPVLAPVPPSAHTASPQSRQPEFKTPTRVPRSKPVPGFTDESPHNDADFQQDIIWDATSPSPRRPGKRGKKPAAGVVNISEIVSRIAPERGRPLVAEPTLQQWIGDSAAIPCTPDVQAPRAKKKSPGPTRVDDLLRLARRFDLSLFQQDQEHRRSLGVLWEDVPASGCPPAGGTGAGSAPDQLLEDDLDFLFDGPTQQVGGALSQVTSSGDAVASTRTRGTPSSCGLVLGPDDAFEDDWESDDLLMDALEMTQNPPQPGGAVWAGPPSGSGVLKDAVGDGSVHTDARKSAWRVSRPPQGQQSPGGAVFGPEPLRPESGRGASGSAPEPAPSVSPRRDAADFLEDDLDSLFSVDPVWDDPVQADPLREACEDVENRPRSRDAVPVQQVPPSTNQRAALQPTLRTCNNRPPALATPPPGRGAGSSLVGLGASGTRTVTPSPRQRTDATHFSFTRPGCPIAMATTNASGKCSAAEIELKKQQAMERRRLRAAQNPPAPT